MYRIMIIEDDQPMADAMQKQIEAWRFFPVPDLLGHYRKMPYPALRDTFQDKAGSLLPIPL